MPIIDILILSVIVFAFTIFAVVLALGDYQTRHIARESRQRALTGARVASLKRSAGAQNVERAAGEKSEAPAQA